MTKICLADDGTVRRPKTCRVPVELQNTSVPCVSTSGDAGRSSAIAAVGTPIVAWVEWRAVFKIAFCGTRHSHARVRRALADFVGAWCEKLAVAHVCKLAGLHWGTVRQIEHARLESQLAALPPAEPTSLVMDEFALLKGHRYARVVLDADSRQALWVGECRSREAIRPFFEWLGPMAYEHPGDSWT